MSYRRCALSTISLKLEQAINITGKLAGKAKQARRRCPVFFVLVNIT